MRCVGNALKRMDSKIYDFEVGIKLLGLTRSRCIIQIRFPIFCLFSFSLFSS